MINVKITVGMFDTPESVQNVKCVRATLAALPNKGDILFYDSAELKSLMAERKKNWGLDGDISLYYVRAIAHLSDGVPLILLGAKEDMIATNYSYYDQKSEQWLYNNFMYLRYMPKQNDKIYVEKLKEMLYVSECMHFPNSREISLTLLRKESSAIVSINNEPIGVTVQDTVAVKIEEISNYLDDTPLPIEVKKCRMDIPVKINDVSSSYMPALRVDAD